MDKTQLVATVSNLFRITGHKVSESIIINHREIDIKAEETQGLVRKIVLIECADYATPVGISKLQEDIKKLRSAKERLRDNAIIMHVSRHGYSPDALGYASDCGVSVFSVSELISKLINFDEYLAGIDGDNSIPTILREYQANTVFYERDPKSAAPSLKFLKGWIRSGSQWLTLLGDYGFGKSWTLKRLLYDLVQEYRKRPLLALMDLARGLPGQAAASRLAGAAQCHGSSSSIRLMG